MVNWLISSLVRTLQSFQLQLINIISCNHDVKDLDAKDLD